MWQLLEPVEARSVDLPGESVGNPAVDGEEPKEASQRAYIVLETRPAQAFAGFGDVRLDIAGLDGSQRDRLCVQVLEKALRCIPVV